MTYAINLPAARPNPLAALAARLRDAAAGYRAYRATRGELSRLSARNLADIGLTEDQIEAVARAHG
jgi:uncharacterized protein YjiS (DUF1127 family)